MYYEDLSPYQYLKGSKEKALNVGWLAAGHAFPLGNVDNDVLQRIRLLCKIRVNGMRGFHVCDFCKVPPDANAGWQWFLNTALKIDGVRVPLGSSEIRVHDKNGAVYAAPNLIHHYIANHGYLPPEEFLQAIRNLKV